MGGEILSGLAAPPPLVDRTDELSQLLDHVHLAIQANESAVVVLRGEAGVGKTSLLATFAHRAVQQHAEAGLLSGYGQAMLNSLASDSFQAVRECLRSLTSSAERSGSRTRLDRVASSFRQHAPDWIESVPVVGQLLAAGVRTGQAFAASGHDRTEIDSRLDQLLRLIEDLLTDSPVLMVLDDLHWADTATIDLLTTIALRVKGPLILVLAYRPDQLHSAEQTHPLQRAVFRLCRYRPETGVIDLPRLSNSDTELLVRQAASGTAVARDVVSRIVRLSAGNPLFAESLVRLGDRAGRSAPRQITAVLEERLSYLTGADQQLLEIAALIGYSFEVDYLAQLARMDIDDVYERLHLLFTEHGLVRPAEPRADFDRYLIHHPLFAQILRERGASNAPRWRRHHSRLLEILEAEPDWDDELQVRAAAVAVAAGNRAKAGALALAAARRQFTLGAVSKARDLARIAVEQTPSFNAYALLAECLSAEGDHVGGTEACAAALACVGTETVAPALEAHVRLLWARNLRMTCRWDQTSQVLDGLIAAHPEPSDIRAQALILKAEVELCGPIQDTSWCIELCDAVTAMGADAEVQSRAYGHRGLAHLAAYEPVDAERWLTLAIEVARTTGHPYAEYEALHWLSKKTMACLELDRSWQLLEELAQMSQTSGVASENPPHLRDSSRVLGLQHRLTESAEAFARYLDVSLPSALGRVATTLACQIRELEDLYGPIAGERLLIELRNACREDLIAADRCNRLADYLRALGHRAREWDPVAFAVTEFGVAQDDAQAADAIFRFDVPSLSQLRTAVRSNGAGS
ncbi:ATP-binding protein [Nocardia sp. NBC_01009]|uniref:ATP-binding protein n=1 Tax=Nocardia sp. NBC_01009 TaxID=2975996 RepID=UPI00386DFC34|nr:AAA family ATPase [Nocardia sp. NBC_01009]